MSGPDVAEEPLVQAATTTPGRPQGARGGSICSGSATLPALDGAAVAVPELQSRAVGRSATGRVEARVGRRDDTGPPTADQPAAGHRDVNGGDPTGTAWTPSCGPTPGRLGNTRGAARILSGVVICAVVNATVGVVGVLTDVDALAVICLTVTPLI